MNHDELIERLENAVVQEPKMPSGRYTTTLGKQAAAALRELQAEIVQWHAVGVERNALLDERDAALREVEEQARLLGMGSEREARLMAELNETLKHREIAEQEEDRLRTLLEKARPHVEDASEWKGGYGNTDKSDEAGHLLAEIDEVMR